MADPIVGFSFYVVRNKEWKYFRAKGVNGRGKTWTDSLETARIYAKVAPARGIASFFASAYPAFGIPDVVRMEVGKIEVLDESERVAAAVEKKRLAKEKADLRNKEYRLKQAQDAVDQAKIKLDKLKEQKR